MKVSLMTLNKRKVNLEKKVNNHKIIFIEN